TPGRSGGSNMRTLVICCVLVAAAAAASAQTRNDAVLRVTVFDATGAVIVGARVTLRVADGRPLTQGEPSGDGAAGAGTGPRGDAIIGALDPGRYTIHVESPGFEAADIRDVRVRAGSNRRDVRLALAKLTATVDVGRDPRERASDPRGDAFATVLGPE